MSNKKQVFAIASNIARKQEAKKGTRNAWSNEMAWLRIFEGLCKVYGANFCKLEKSAQDIEKEADEIYERHYEITKEV